MHLLAAHNRSEFLAVPQLIRFEYVQGESGFEPTFLLKCCTLLLKYVLLGAPMMLAFRLIGSRLLYALKINDDGDSGAVLWSVVEREEEINGIRGLASGAALSTFLFNEIAVNVAWREVPATSSNADLAMWATIAEIGAFDHSSAHARINEALNCLHRRSDEDDGWIRYQIGGFVDWKRILNHFLPTGAPSSLIDIFDRDEGRQQEQIGIWLTDNLNPNSVYHSPQVFKGGTMRELTDILLSHWAGTVLIESKTLSILARNRLPDRSKLIRDVAGHVEKAFDQLQGGIRQLRAGAALTRKDGAPIDVERKKPPHAIVLIPDLDLIADPPTYGLKFITDFVRATGALPHLLDLSELLRVVQAAEMIALRGQAATIMEAFDYYLMERSERAMKAGTLRIKVLLRFEEDAVDENRKP